MASFPEVNGTIWLPDRMRIILKVVVPDIDAYQHFLLNQITRIEGVSGVHSSFVMAGGGYGGAAVELC